MHRVRREGRNYPNPGLGRTADPDTRVAKQGLDQSVFQCVLLGFHTLGDWFESGQCQLLKRVSSRLTIALFAGRCGLERENEGAPRHQLRPVRA